MTLLVMQSQTQCWLTADVADLQHAERDTEQYFNLQVETWKFFHDMQEL